MHFIFCIKQEKFENNTKPELQIIENSAFELSSIKTFIFPTHISITDSNAFGKCYNLNEFIIPENSELKTIGNSAFDVSLIPNNLVELKYAWFIRTKFK